jgi:hypothetical protein
MGGNVALRRFGSCFVSYCPKWGDVSSGEALLLGSLPHRSTELKQKEVNFYHPTLNPLYLSGFKN